MQAPFPGEDHWIYTLKKLGLNDGSVTADYPLVGVFTRNGKKTNAAYNGDARPRNVTFSDGTKLEAKPRALTVQPGSDRRQAPR